jgi:Flp pilus assembly protein TadG
MKRFKTLVNPLRRKRGAVAVLTVVMLVVLIGFASLTIDVGVMFNTRAELQNTADAAALAGAQMLPDGAAARQTAVEYANRNSSRHGIVVANSDVVLGHWDAAAAVFTPGGAPVDAVHVLARCTESNGNPLKLFFAPILGISQTDVSASATASFGKAGRWDVVIVQDVTGSFKDEIDEARIADQGLLDCIRDHAPDTYLGLAVFTGFGKLIASLQSVDVAYDSLSASIGALKSCGSTGMPQCSGTNIGAGIDTAIPLLTASTTKRPRAIIIVSDGQPNSSLPGYTTKDLANWAVKSADKAAASDISIFTLFFSGNDTSAGAAAFLAGLVRGEGTAHETPDPTEIATELQEICLEGLSLMLVQ